MIHVTFHRNLISVLADPDEPILTGVHRAYFETILNFRRRADGQGYDWPGVERIGDQLRDISEYLEESGFAFDRDAEAQRVFERARGAEARLAGAIAAGREVLDLQGPVPPEIPDLRRPLLQHQIIPVLHLLAVPNAANFSVPGAGKTTIVFAAFQRLRADDQVDVILVVGPGSSFIAWEDEFEACFGKKANVVRLSGSPEEREVAYIRAEHAELILVTYHTANNDRARLVELMRSRRIMLVLDESHYVKGTGALAETVLQIAPEASRRIVLTGTPMPNGYTDLWTQAAFLWPEQHLFGNRVQFRTLVSNAPGQNEAKARMRPLFTRVRKSELGLPEQRYIRIPISMGPHQQRIYNILAARTLNDIALLPNERPVIRQWRRARMIRLLQAASNPALLAQPSIEFALPPEEALDRPVLEILQNFMRYEMPKKVLAAAELVRRLLQDPNEKVVVWTHFVRNVELLLELLKEFGALPLYGAVPREGPDDEEYTREQHIRAFRSSRECRVLVANPGAAAESISLHRVSHNAVYLDRTFNAGQFIQSRDRIHRVGLRLDESVTYHLLLSEATIDQTIDARLLTKEERMMELLDDPDLPATELQISTDHLCGPDEQEEEIDFAAVIEDLRRRLNPGAE